MVGVDAAFRWLVVGRARLREAGVDAALYCANAEYLPFTAGSFGAVTANDLVEHVEDPPAVFRECRRVLRPGGPCYVSANNRYSLLPEPHTGVWGAGWMPRPLQVGYVELISGRSYRNICLRSGPELERAARLAGFAGRRVEAAPPASPPESWPRGQALYRRLRGWAPMRWIGPRVQLLCR